MSILKGQIKTSSGDILYPQTSIDKVAGFFGPYYCAAAGTAAVTTSGSETCAIWTLTNADAPALTNGLTVIFTVPVAGDNEYGVGIKLNSDTTAHPVICDAASTVGTRYPNGSAVIATYNSTATGKIYSNGTQQTVTGCW